MTRLKVKAWRKKWRERKAKYNLIEKGERRHDCKQCSEKYQIQTFNKNLKTNEKVLSEKERKAGRSLPGPKNPSMENVNQVNLEINQCIMKLWPAHNFRWTQG